MKKFKFEDYQGAYVMVCKNKDELNKFQEYARTHNKSIAIDSLYDIEWKIYFNEQHVFFDSKQDITIDKVYCYKLNFSDFDWSEDKMFTKADLKTGDFVVETYGVEIVNKEYNVLICRNGGFNILSELDINDIEKVYRPKNEMTCCFNNYNKGTLIYDRSEQPVEMTIEEISKALGKKVKVVG